MKVLIIKASALGDVVHALPVLAWVKSADPAVEIDWLVEESFVPVLEGHPLLRSVIPLQTKAWRRDGGMAGVRGAWGLIRRLRRENYDMVLDLQGNSKSGLFTWFAAPERYGFDKDGVKEWPNLLVTNHKVALTEDDYHISDRSLAIARSAFPAGTDVRNAGPLHVDEDAKEKVARQLADVGFSGDARRIVLHYGTTWVTKHWPQEMWQQLAERLVRKLGVAPILTWGNNEEHQAAERIMAATDGQGVIWPRGSLSELVALLGQVDLVVGSDTGPIHIAAALETKTVSLFRVTDSRRNGPRGDGHITLQASMDCSPCLRKSCEIDMECGRSIPVDLVYASICRLL